MIFFTVEAAEREEVMGFECVYIHKFFYVFFRSFTHSLNVPNSNICKDRCWGGKKAAWRLLEPFFIESKRGAICFISILVPFISKLNFTNPSIATTLKDIESKYYFSFSNKKKEWCTLSTWTKQILVFRLKTAKAI